jgi:stearoyl-CoA desaturase (Delta-9 desaturase)
MIIILIFFLAHWYLSLFSQTFFQHRYAAHSAFTMSRGWERFFYLFAYVTQGSSFMSPRAYAIMHRMHHAYTDTEKDPHSPSYDDNVFKMMWRTKNIYTDILNNNTSIEERFLKNVPNWPALERVGHLWFLRVLWVAFYVAFYFIFAPNYWYFLLLPIHILMGPIHGAIINWFAHKYQYINFKLANTSKNLFPIDIFMLGEAYHNNHHKFPSRINFGFRWHELDPIYPVILFFNWIGILKINKLVLKPVNAEF